MHFVLRKLNDLLIEYILNKLETFSIQTLNINQNPIHIKTKQLVINNLQRGSVEIPEGMILT